MPCKDELPPHTPGIDVFERQVLSVKALLDKGLIKHWGLSNGMRARVRPRAWQRVGPRRAPFERAGMRGAAVSRQRRSPLKS